MSPKVTVITVVLNNKDGLQETITSVIGQTYTNIEYIVIDGGSTDGSVEVIKKFESKISKWISEPDKGIYNAMNKGIRMAEGDYLMFLNSGDYIYNSEIISDVFAKNDLLADILYGNTMFKSIDSPLFEKHCPSKLSLDFLIEDDINHQSCFIHKSLFDIYGYYDENYKITSDHKFFFKALILGNASTLYKNIFITVYNLHGISSNQELQLNERIAVEKEVLSPLILDFYEKYKCLKEEEKKYGYLKEAVKNRFIRKALKIYLHFKQKKVTLLKTSTIQ